MSLAIFSSDPQFWIRVRQRTLCLMRKHTRPVLLGEISMETRLNLRQTREMLDALMDEGIVRELDEVEVKAYPNMYAGYAFVLVDPKSFPGGDIEP
jgi:hypothetical protein